MRWNDMPSRRVEGGHDRAGLGLGRIHKVLSSLRKVAVALRRVTVASGQEDRSGRGVAGRGPR